MNPSSQISSPPLLASLRFAPERERVFRESARTAELSRELTAVDHHLHRAHREADLADLPAAGGDGTGAGSCLGPQPLLEARHVHGGYGSMNILNGVDMTLYADEVGVIVGPILFFPFSKTLWLAMDYGLFGER